MARELLKAAQGHIRYVALSQAFSLTVAIILEIGREPVYGGVKEYLSANTSDDMIEEAENLV